MYKKFVQDNGLAQSEKSIFFNLRLKVSKILKKLLNFRNSNFGISHTGFTLVELILVVLILGILAAFTITSLRPAKQLANQRDAQRKADLISILNAIKQYSIDNNGSLPSAIQLDSNCATPATSAQICRTGNAILLCLGNNTIPMYDLTTNSKYLVSMPIDPISTSTYGTGYNVVKDANNRVTVCAPLTESTTTPISFIR
jgi:prepilin-type N-terminal cleavage/methylation domain-containing protein